MLFADAWLAGKWAERAGPPEFHRSRMSPVLAVLSVSQQPNHLEVADRWQCVWPVPEMSWTYRSTWGKPRHVVSVNLGESVNFSRSRGQNMSSGSSHLDYRSTWGESPFRYRSTWGNTGTAVSVNLGGKRPKLSVNLGDGSELFRSTWGEKGQNYRSTWGETVHTYRSTWGENSAEPRHRRV